MSLLFSPLCEIFRPLPYVTGSGKIDHVHARIEIPSIDFVVTPVHYLDTTTE